MITLKTDAMLPEWDDIESTSRRCMEFTMNVTMLSHEVNVKSNQKQ